MQQTRVAQGAAGVGGIGRVADLDVLTAQQNTAVVHIVHLIAGEHHAVIGHEAVETDVVGLAVVGVDPGVGDRSAALVDVIITVQIVLLPGAAVVLGVDGAAERGGAAGLVGQLAGVGLRQGSVRCGVIGPVLDDDLAADSKLAVTGNIEELALGDDEEVGGHD